MHDQSFASAQCAASSLVEHISYLPIAHPETHAIYCFIYIYICININIYAGTDDFTDFPAAAAGPGGVTNQTGLNLTADGIDTVAACCT